MAKGISRTSLAAIPALTILLIIAAMLSPEEATLGEKIRWVYVHVAFTWAGTSLINLAGLAGLYLIVRPTATRLSLWFAPAQAAGLILFGVGFVLSLIASWVSWGGILWMEPRVISSVGILAGGTALIMIIHATANPRIVGILSLLLSLGLSLVLGNTAKVFHPDNAIDASDSSMIRLTFYALTVLAMAIGIVLTTILRRALNSRSV